MLHDRDWLVSGGENSLLPTPNDGHIAANFAVKPSSVALPMI